MTSIFLIIQALLPIVLQELGSVAGLNPNIGTLISGIEAAVAEFLTLIRSGQGNTVTATSLLAAIQAAVSILQHQTNLSPVTLSYIAALDKAIQAGIDANAALTSVDPSKLNPITPV